MKTLREILGEDLYNKGAEETFFLKLDAKSRKPVGYSKISGGGWWTRWVED